MRFGGGLGSEASRVALFVLATISCGETVRRGQSSDGPAPTAVGGSSTATDGPVASQAGAAISNPQGGVPSTNSAGTSGGEAEPEEAGQGGAGGWSSPAGDFRFEIIPSLDPAGPVRAGVRYFAQWISASTDGAVLAGFSSVYDDTAAYSPSGVRFLWTADRKTEALPSGSPESGLFEGQTLSEDGTSLLGYVSKLEILSPTSSSFGPVSFFRWTRAEGDVRFSPPESVLSIQLELVSADGTTALGAVQRTADEYLRFRWTEADGFAYLSELGYPPDATYAAISSNGEVIAGNHDPGQAFIWSETNHLVALGAPPGFPYCFVESLSPDGSVALGSCTDADGTTSTTFRWTAAGGLVDLSLPGYADSTSDGRVAVGTDGQVVYRWTEGKPTLELEPPPSWAAGSRYSISLIKGVSLSQDGGTFHGRFFLDVDRPEPTSFPFRWSEREGFVRLELLPGRAHGVVVAQTSDGSVQVGVCWSGEGTEEAVLWDSGGVRQIGRELSEAGIDLQGLQLGAVSYVWSGSSLMVAGAGKAKDGNGNAWIAWLPKRP